MKSVLARTGVLAATAASLAAIAIPAVAADAASSCKTGKEGSGCPVKVGAFYLKSNPGLVVSLAKQTIDGKPAKAVMQVPGTLLCPGAQGNSYINVIAYSSGYPKVGKTTKFKLTTVKIESKTYKTTGDLKLKVKSAKKAKATGSVKVDYGDGSPGCSGAVSGNLTRALGG